MAHICNGSNTPMDREAIQWNFDLPVTALNYGDTWDNSLHFDEARKKTDKVLVGGIKHCAHALDRRMMNGLEGGNDFSGPYRDMVKKQLRFRVDSAIAAAGNKLVLAGGCGCYAPHRFPVFDEVLEEVAAERAAARK